MRFAATIACLYGIVSCAQSAAIPDLSSLSKNNLIESFTSSAPNLFKRKGGGGGGRGGGSSSGGSRGGGTTSSGTSGYSSTSGRTGSTSSTGGSTSYGSGPARTYGGGSYYAGGAATPYAAGSLSRGGISPIFIAAPALAFGGLWAYGAYSYPYHNPYVFHNTSRSNGTNESIPVQCWCEQQGECGCDDNGNSTYLDSIVGNGTGIDPTVAKVVNLNGTDTLVINGSLPNGTTAPGGTDDGVVSSGAFRLDGVGHLSGWWMMLSCVLAIVLSI